MLQGAIIGGSIALIMMLIGYFVAKGSKAATWLNKPGKRTEAFETALSPAEVIQKLSAGLEKVKAKLGASDATTNRLVLEQAPNYTAVFFPVQAVAKPGGGSTVTMGVAPRGLIWGPALGVMLRKAVAEAKTLLGAAA